MFALLNSRSQFDEAFKKPLFLNDAARSKGIVERYVNYLIKLTDNAGLALIQHRKNCFVLGFITALTSIRDLSFHLLARSENPFNYVFTYKMSQGHFDLLFSCIRRKNGFNSNPKVVQLKSSPRRILLRNAIIGSKHANCITFEESSTGSIFSFKWTRRRTPMVINEVSAEGSQEIQKRASFLENYSLSGYKKSILGYIAR